VTKIVYILAASHSGSTLLSMLLNAHRLIASVGELKLSPSAMGNINCYRCSCGEFIHQCQFWRKLKEELARRGYEFDIANACTDYGTVKSQYAQWMLGPLHRGMLLESFRDIALSLSPTWRKHVSEIHRRNAALASTISEIMKVEVIVDSSKTALRLKYLLRNPELDVKVIRLIRNGRGVALTYMDPAGFADANDPNLRSGGTGGNRENEQLSIAQAAHQWRRSNEEAEHILRQLDKSLWLEVRYEELCNNTKNTLERLYEFLGLETDKYARDFRTVENHIVGNGMRLDTTSMISLDERWKSVLSEEELQIFDNEAGEMYRRYGYE